MNPDGQRLQFCGLKVPTLTLKRAERARERERDTYRGSCPTPSPHSSTNLLSAEDQHQKKKNTKKKKKNCHQRACPVARQRGPTWPPTATKKLCSGCPSRTFLPRISWGSSRNCGKGRQLLFFFFVICFDICLFVFCFCFVLLLFFSLALSVS